MSNGVCVARRQEIANTVVSDVSGLGMVIFSASVMLLGKVTGISICDMNESHVTHICCSQHELESIDFRCGAVHALGKERCVWCDVVHR